MSMGKHRFIVAVALLLALAEPLSAKPQRPVNSPHTVPLEWPTAIPT